MNANQATTPDIASAPESRSGQILLLAAFMFGFIYLLDDFGLSAPYPINVVIKASGIVLLGLYALHRSYIILAIGLLAGSAGDVFLALEPARLDLGIAAFGLGHLIYIVLFGQQLLKQGLRGTTGFAAAGGIALFGTVMLLWLQPYFGDLRIAASIYNGLILTMAILAVLGKAPKMAIIGALLFVVSDSVLALRLFADMLDWAGPVVWVTYFLGQAGIAYGLSRTKTNI